jgi:hypothetical protein
MPTSLENTEGLVQTRLLIEREPSTIVITRPPADTSDGAGGRLRGIGRVQLDPQTVFISGVTRDSDYRQSSFATGEDGESYTNVIIIIGYPGELDINQYDEFDWNGDRIRVDFRFPDNGYEVRAQGRRVTNGGR